MGLARSTFYDIPLVSVDEDELLARIGTICDQFECYGYRRVGAALRQQGVVVNGKRLRRLMRELGLQPRRRRRYVVTTDSDHTGPIYPDLAKNLVPDRPNQLWVADLTYVTVPGGFVYLAALPDAWSRKVVGYAISRSMNARIAVAALKAAIRSRAPVEGCIHHSDRGSQYASEVYRELLATHGLTGSMSRRGNPYDNAKAESFMKTLKVGGVCRDPQADAYAGFSELYHPERKLFDLAHLAKAPLAAEAVGRIDAIFDAKRGINGLPAEQRLAVRQAHVAPLVTELEVWMRAARAKMSRHANVGCAMNDMLKRWNTFCRFLHDGRICLTNNAAERALRSVALGRKAGCSAARTASGERTAAIYSLVCQRRRNSDTPALPVLDAYST